MTTEPNDLIGPIHNRMPVILKPEDYDTWLDGGAVSTEERCRQRKVEILATHEPEPISNELERALDEIVAAARRDLLGKGA